MTRHTLPMVLVNIHKSYFIGSMLNMAECPLTRKPYLSFIVGLHRIRESSPSGLLYYPYYAPTRIFVELSPAEYKGVMSFKRAEEMNYDPLCYLRETLATPGQPVFMETSRREIGVSMRILRKLDIRLYNKYNNMSSAYATHFNVAYHNHCYYLVYGVRRLNPADISNKLMFARYKDVLINPIFNR
jgi:hypothetical protein